MPARPNARRHQQLRADAGQLIVFGFDGTTLDQTVVDALRLIQPAGVILFARNITDAQQTAALLLGCQQQVKTPLFRCVDMEGGTVDRLKKVFAPAPSAAAVFATEDRKLFREHGKLIGAECRLLGFNVDFAPVLDLALPESRAVMGPRTVSASPKETTRYAREFLAGLKTSKVLGCGKHFPGLGAAALDTHFTLPSLDRDLNTLLKSDLVPYQALGKQMPFVMVAHAAYPQVTGDALPASLSRDWLTGVLRQRLVYAGLVITDDLEMGGVLAKASIGEAAVQTLRAGADLYLVCHKLSNVVECYEAVVRAAEKDSTFANVVTAAAKRVRARKARMSELRGKIEAPEPAKVQQLREQMERFAEVVTKKQKRELAHLSAAPAGEAG